MPYYDFQEETQGIFTPLAVIQQIAATPSALIINTGRKTRINEIIFHNTGAALEIIKLYYVPPSAGALGTAAITNLFLKLFLDIDETAHQTFQKELSFVDFNHAIFGESTTAGKVNVIFLGDKGV